MGTAKASKAVVEDIGCDEARQLMRQDTEGTLKQEGRLKLKRHLNVCHSCNEKAFEEEG